jgi:hypothetical protein
LVPPPCIRRAASRNLGPVLATPFAGRLHNAQDFGRLVPTYWR